MCYFFYIISTQANAAPDAHLQKLDFKIDLKKNYSVGLGSFSRFSWALAKKEVLI